MFPVKILKYIYYYHIDAIKILGHVNLKRPDATIPCVRKQKYIKNSVPKYYANLFIITGVKPKQTGNNDQ